VLFQGFEHTQVGHASCRSAAKRQADLHATQIMDDALDALSQQFAMIRPQLAGVCFEVAGGQVVELGGVRRRRRSRTEAPDDAHLIAQAL